MRTNCNSFGLRIFATVLYSLARSNQAREPATLPKPAPQRQKNTRVGFLTVGQTARILGISPSTLRLWENVGLVTPARSDGHFRLYSPETLKALKRIKYLRDVKKLSLPGIKREIGGDGKAERKKSGKPVTDLGQKLRAFRKRRGLSIAEASALANISAGFLSAVELSQANASVATLQKLSAAYETNILEFYDLPPQSGRIIRPEDRQAIDTESGVRMELLSTGSKMLESMLFRVPPGAGSDGSYAHEGEEFIYMMSGQLEIWLDEIECHVINEGDSFWFESQRGHRWFNPSETEAVLLWVNTPLSF